VRLLDRNAEFRQRELASQDIRARRHHAAANHDLDHVGPPLGPRADGSAQRIRAGRLASHRPAVAADAGDRRAGRDDRRQRRGQAGAALTVPPRDHRPVTVAEIPDGGDASSQVPPQCRPDHGLQPVIGVIGEPVQRPVRAVPAEVDVRVRQPGHDGRARVVQNLPVRSDLGMARFDAGDPARVDEDRHAAGHCRLAVKAPGCPQCVHRHLQRRCAIPRPSQCGARECCGATVSRCRLSPRRRRTAGAGDARAGPWRPA